MGEPTPLTKTQHIVDNMYSEWLAEQSLFEFVKQAWPIIESATFQSNYHIEAICDHLEAVRTGDIKRLIINVHPRSTKTSLFNVLFPVWCWLHNPGEQFLCVSASQDLAFKGATDSRNIIQSDWFRKRWGHKFKLSADQNAKNRYTNNKNGYRISTTFEAKNIGRGGDIMTVDDPNSPFESEVETKNVIERWTGTLSNRLNDPRESRVVLGQQRTGPNDLTAYLLKTDAKSWVHLSLPSEYDTKRGCKTIILPATAIRKSTQKPWADRRTKDKELLWPSRFDDQTLSRIKAAIGPKIFEAQYNQNPIQDTGGILLREYWRRWTGERIPQLSHMYQSWDCALTGRETSDYNACVTLGEFWLPPTEESTYNGPFFIVLSVWRGQCGLPQLIERAKRLYWNCADIGNGDPLPKWSKQPDQIVIEGAANGFALQDMLHEAGLPAAIKTFDSKRYGDKVARANLAAPYLSCRLIYARTTAPFFSEFTKDAEMLIAECEEFPNGRNDDQVDAFTQIVLYLRSLGRVVHLDDRRYIDDGLRPILLPGARKEGEEFFRQVALWKAEAEVVGAQQQEDRFAFIYRNKDQTYEDFKKDWGHLK